MTATSLLIEDIAEQLACAEDAGFNRALTCMDLPDLRRWELQMENNRTHKTRVRLYVAQLTKDQAA